MPDNQERIVLGVDDSQAIVAQKRTEKGFEGVEKAAVKAGETSGRMLVSITDRTKNAIERTVQVAEKKAQGIGRNAIERLESERALLVKRVQGDTQAVERLNSAYQKLISAQKQVDSAAMLEKATVASQRAAKASMDFERALVATNRAAQADAANQERRVRTLERQAALAGRTGAQRASIQQQFFLEDIGKATPENIARVRSAFEQMERAGQQSQRSIGQEAIALAGRLGLVLGAGQAVRLVFKDLILDSTLYAARSEQLGVALNAVARANGIAESTAANFERRLKSLGITTQESRSSLARLIAGGIDINQAEALARAAQDLGRVSGIPSSDALEKLVHAIVTLQPELFRTLGLNVSLENSYKRVAREQNRQVDSLTELEKRQIATNEALRQAQAYAGVYADSFGTAGGQILSLDRYQKEFRNSLGNELLPILTQAIKLVTLFGKNAEDAGAAVGRGVKNLAGGIFAPFTFGGLKVFEQIQKFTESLPKDLSEKDRADRVRAQSLKLLMELERKSAEEAGRVNDLREKQAKEIAKAEKEALDFRKQAELQELEGIDRVIQRRQQMLDEGIKSSKQLADIERGINHQLTDEFEKQQKKMKKIGEKIAKDRIKDEIEKADAIAKIRGDFFLKTVDLQRQAAIEQKQLDIESVEIETERALGQLDVVGRKDIQGLIAIEQRRAEIARQGALRVFELRSELLALQVKQEIASIEAVARARGDSENAIGLRREYISRTYEAKARELAIQTQSVVDKTKETASKRIAEVQIREQERVFESIKRSAGDLFDELVRGGKNAGEVLMAALKTALLTPVKEMVSTLIAGILTGQRVAFGGAGGGGRSFGIGSVFGGFGGFGSPGAPGGTPGFAGPVGGGRGFSFPGFGGFSGIRDFFGLGSSISTGAGSATTFGAATLGQKLSALGKSDAALLGGIGLGIAGLQRGGLSGLGMTTGAGALIGFRFGGPLGAAIGAGIGAGAGLVRLFVKGAADKIVEKVKNLYGISITKEFAKDPLLPMIKQLAGGNIDLGLRIPQVRDLIELYGMSMGQGNGPLGNRMMPTAFADTGASLRQLPTFFNGSPLSATPSQPVVIGSVQLVVGQQSAAAFMDGRIAPVVASSPRAVAEAAGNAQRLSINRRQQLGQQFGLVTA